MAPSHAVYLLYQALYILNRNGIIANQLILGLVTSLDRVGRIVPRLGPLHELVVHAAVAAAGDVQHLGVGGGGVVAERGLGGDEDDVALDQRDALVAVDVDDELALLELEGHGGRVRDGLGRHVGHHAADDHVAHGEVAGRLVARGEGGHDAVDAAVRVEVLGAPALGDKVGRSGVGAQLVGAVVPVGGATGAAVDHVAAGVVLELGVHVKGLEGRDDRRVRGGGVGDVGGNVLRAYGRVEGARGKGDEERLKATRLNDTRKLRVGVHDLEGVGGVVRNSTVVTLRQQTSRLAGSISLCPELDSALGAVKVLVVRLVDVRQDTEASTRGGVGLHQREGAVGGVASDREAVDLGADLDCLAAALAQGVWSGILRRFVDENALVACPSSQRLGKGGGQGDGRGEDGCSLHCRSVTVI